MSIIFLIIYLFFLLVFRQYMDIWWDEASYIGMAKYLFSFGKDGIFEPMKSILLPIFLGLPWKLGLDVVLSGKIFILIVSTLALVVLYLISKEFFDENLAIFAVSILFFNVLFFIFIFRIYTEMLSLLFILGAVFFMLRFSNKTKKILLFLSALFCFLAFLTKYPNILIFGILNLYLLLKDVKSRKFYNLLWFNLFFIIIAAPFFILNYLVSGNALYLWDLSQAYFRENLGTLYGLGAFPGIPKILFENNGWIYFKSLIYLFNILLPFAAYGLYLLIKERKHNFERSFLLLVPAIAFFCFLEIFYLKSERYLLPIFPFIAIFAAYGLSKIKIKKAYVILGIYILISLISSVYFFSSSSELVEHNQFFIKPPINFSCEKVASSDPRAGVNYEIIFPYVLFDNNSYLGIIAQEKPDCVFYFSCESQETHMKILNSWGYSVKYYQERANCSYAILKK